LVRSACLGPVRFEGIRETTYDSAHRSNLTVGKTFVHYVVL